MGAQDFDPISWGHVVVGSVPSPSHSVATMGSNSMPVRIAHGWAIAWLDFYQTPAIVSEGVVSEVKGFFREVGRAKGAYPHNHVNPQTADLNRLGRPKQFASDDTWAFSGCS